MFFTQVIELYLNLDLESCFRHWYEASAKPSAYAIVSD